MSRREAQSLCVALVALRVLTACTWVTGYPTPVAEVGERLCGNDVDDNLNGLRDCDDPACDGHCTEGAAAPPSDRSATCADGRDQDLDLLKDAEDPDCFLFAQTFVERCWSTPELDLAIPPSAWLGDATVEVDPSGSSAEVVLVLRADARDVESVQATHVRSFAGGADGTVLRARVYAGPDTDVTVALGRRRTGAGPLGPTEVGFRLTAEDGATPVFLPEPAGPSTRVPLPRWTTPRWASVEVEYHVHPGGLTGSLRYRIAPDGIEAVEATVEVRPFRPAAAADPLELGWQVHPSDEIDGPDLALLTDIELHRAGYELCGHEVPQIEIPVLPVMFAPNGIRVLGAASARDGEWCVLADQPGGPSSAERVTYVFESTDDGATFLARDRIEGMFAGGGLAWDEARGEYRGVLERVGDSWSTESIVALRSATCGGFEISDAGIPALDALAADMAATYTIGRDGRHELAVITGNADTTLLRRFVSESGEPGTFVQRDAEPFEGEVGNVFVRIAEHSVFLGSAMELRVEAGDGWTTIERLVEPTEITGTFDELGVHALGLALAPGVGPTVWRGLILHGNGGMVSSQLAAQRFAIVTAEAADPFERTAPP